MVICCLSDNSQIPATSGHLDVHCHSRKLANFIQFECNSSVSHVLQLLETLLLTGKQLYLFKETQWGWGGGVKNEALALQGRKDKFQPLQPFARAILFTLMESPTCHRRISSGTRNAEVLHLWDVCCFGVGAGDGS